MRKDDFRELKEAYEMAREEERVKLVEVLASAGYEVSTRGGRGVAYYTSQGRMQPYDLSNFKFIWACKDGVKYFISLQPFEQDSRSKNFHVLEDRIGFYSYKGEYNPEEAIKNMKIVDADLPLSDVEYNHILNELSLAAVA